MMGGPTDSNIPSVKQLINYQILLTSGLWAPHVCVCLLRDKTQNFGIQKDAELRFKTIVRLLILLPPARSRFRLAVKRFKKESKIKLELETAIIPVIRVRLMH